MVTRHRDLFSKVCEGSGGRSVCAPALRTTPCGCYKSRMGTQGLRNRAGDCPRAADRPHGVSLALIAACLVVLPALVGCSGSSSSSLGGPGPAQQAAMPPPPIAAAAPPGSAAAPGPATAAVAQPPAAQASTGHVDFLSMFRDPPSQTTAGPFAAAHAGIANAARNNAQIEIFITAAPLRRDRARAAAGSAAGPWTFPSSALPSRKSAWRARRRKPAREPDSAPQ